MIASTCVAASNLDGVALLGLGAAAVGVPLNSAGSTSGDGAPMIPVGAAVTLTGFACTRGDGPELPLAIRPIAKPASNATMTTIPTMIPAVRRITCSVNHVAPHRS